METFGFDASEVKVMSVLRGFSRWLGMFGVALFGLFVVVGCETASSTASSSASSSSSFEVRSNVERTTVIDRTATFTPQVQFETENRLGTVKFAVQAVPDVDWFAVDSTGTLHFRSGQMGEYDSPLLGEVRDAGEGKAIAVTVTAIDEGRGSGNTALASVTVAVVLRPFGLVATPAVTYVADGGSVLQDYVSFSPVNAHGKVRYQIKTAPAVDWLEVRSDGFLFLTGDASYAALEAVDDDGDGKPITVTIEAEDTGREASNRATALVEVRVLPPPFALTASPSTVTLASGSNRLNAANAILVSLVEDDHLLGTAEYALAGSWAELGWFDVVPGEGNTAVISLNRVLDYHAIDAAVAAGNKLIQLEVRMRDSGRAASSLAEMVVDVVVTLTSAEEPLSLWPTRTLTSVSDGKGNQAQLGDGGLPPEVRFTPNALGAMSYEVLSTTPDVDWFEVGVEVQGGVLRFADGKVADYAALTGVEDLGSGKPVVVTVRGTDAGRSGSNTADVAVTVDVRASALTLAGNPATLNVVSGSAELTSGSTPTQGYTVENRIGAGRYTLAGTTPFVDWFAIDGATGELSLKRPADYSLLPDAGEGNDRTVTATVQLMDVGRQTNNVATTAIEVRVQAPTTLTLLANESATTVADGSQVLFPSIQFSTQGAADASAVTYTVDSVVPSGASWFDAATGVLEMTSAAVYSALGNDLVASDGAKTVAVTVKAEQGGEEDTLTVSVRVTAPVGAFALSANTPEAYVEDDSQALDREVTFTPSSGTVTYAVATVPSVSWFAVDVDGNLTLSSNADYDAAGLPFDDGTGRPVTVTVTATEGGGAKAAASVVVRVLPPALTLSIDPSPAEVMHGLSGADIATATATGVIGVRSYVVTSAPFVDWFRVNPSTGKVSVRPDRTVDWNTLSVAVDEDGKKAITLAIRLTDSGRSTTTSASTFETTLTVNISPAPLAIEVNQATSYLDHGLGNEASTGIALSAQNALGSISHVIATTPALGNWFEVDTTTEDGTAGDIKLRAEVSLDYNALIDSSTTPIGRPVYLTITSEDDGRSSNNSALISVIVYVKPPPLFVSVTPTEVIWKDGATTEEVEPLAISIGNAVGDITFALVTSPNIDWFEVIERDGASLITLKFEAYVDSFDLPTVVDEEGRRSLALHVIATDATRRNTSTSALSDVITIKVGPGPTISLNADKTEFFEKGSALEPVLRYELQGTTTQREYVLSWSRDITLCDSEGTCTESVAWTAAEDNRTGQLQITTNKANFWVTKFRYDGRGDEERLPLYQTLTLAYESHGFSETLSRNYIVELKNVPNDESFTFPEDETVAIPEGDANDPFFFPISQKNFLPGLPHPALIHSVVVTDPKFTARDVGFAYSVEDGSLVQLDAPIFPRHGVYNLEAGEYGGTHELGKIFDAGWVAFKPSVHPGYIRKQPGPDFRIALRPGETLTYDPNAETIPVTVSINLRDADPATGTIEVEVISRQDGTEDYPFLVSGANDLESLAAERKFSNAYTRKYCSILPACRNGELASFYTQVSDYRQTGDIALEPNDSLGALPVHAGYGDPRLPFHGTYDGGGYQISGLDTEGGGLFGTIASEAVLKNIHLVDVDVRPFSNPPFWRHGRKYDAGALVRRVDREFSNEKNAYYFMQQHQFLSLRYFDIYFTRIWNYFEGVSAWVGLNSQRVYRMPLVRPLVLNSSATGSVAALDDAGGLVGVLDGGDVQGSYSTASVESIDLRAGGLVSIARDGARIWQSFATGDVTGFDEAGGLVGLAHNGALIEASFALGVPSAEYVGALLGGGDHFTLRDSYGLGHADRNGYGSDGVRTYGSAGDPDGAGAFTSWTCASAPFHAVDLDGTDNGDCSTVGASSFPWDFGTAGDAQYPVPSGNVLTPAEIRALLPTP